ncbi:MAG: MarP family serine protease [Mobilicoccus sp.]|nr:MarP family serine protease [Mobilicoccus sp.]
MSPATGSLVLDGLLLLSFVLYTVDGLHRGVIRAGSSTLGLVAGGLLAFRFAPAVIERVAPDLGHLPTLVLLAGAVLIAALIAQGIVLGVATSLFSRREGGPGPLDRILGGLFSLALAVSFAWLAGGLLRVAVPGDVAAVVDGSRVVTALDDAAPVSSARVLDSAGRLFREYDFPRVIDGGESIAAVEEADPDTAHGQAVVEAGASVVRIDATAGQCRRMQEGSGFVVGPDLVVTNAHVVTGASRVVVRRDRLRNTAEVVAFDPRRDLAVLAVDTEDLAPLPLADGDLRRGDDAVVAGFPLGGPYTVDAARVRESMTARGRDIYDSDRVVRDVYALRAEIEPGNSGGPVLTLDGDVAGVVFARSYDDPGTAYALRLSELAPVLEIAAAGQPVDVGSCLP